MSNSNHNYIFNIPFFKIRNHASDQLLCHIKAKSWVNYHLAFVPGGWLEIECLGSGRGPPLGYTCFAGLSLSLGIWGAPKGKCRRSQASFGISRVWDYIRLLTIKWPCTLFWLNGSASLIPNYSCSQVVRWLYNVEKNGDLFRNLSAIAFFLDLTSLLFEGSSVFSWHNVSFILIQTVLEALMV